MQCAKGQRYPEQAGAGWHPGSGTQVITRPSTGQNTAWPMNEKITLGTRRILSCGKVYINISAAW